MKTLNERMNDSIIINNVSEIPAVIITQDKPKGVIIASNKTFSVLVKDLVSSLRGDKVLYGVDNKGTHARLYIEDDGIRELLKFDEYETVSVKGKGADKDKTTEKKQIKKKQLVLSKSVFIKNVKVQTNSDFTAYASSLKEVTNGGKMMVAAIIRDERKGQLKGLSLSRFDELAEVISH